MSDPPDPLAHLLGIGLCKLHKDVQRKPLVVDCLANFTVVMATGFRLSATRTMICRMHTMLVTSVVAGNLIMAAGNDHRGQGPQTHTIANAGGAPQDVLGRGLLRCFSQSRNSCWAAYAESIPGWR